MCLCRHLLFMVIQPFLLLSWNSRQYRYNVVLHILGCLKCCFNTPELLSETEQLLTSAVYAYFVIQMPKHR